MKVYVGNLSGQATDSTLNELARPYGTPTSANVAVDRLKGTPRGFGFITFATDEEGRAAIAGLDGKDVDGQQLKVNEARSPKAVPPPQI